MRRSFFALALSLPVLLFADGMFLPYYERDLHEPEQRAVLSYDQSIERLILQVSYQGPAEDFAWVVPTPSKPTVVALKPEQSPFGKLARTLTENFRVNPEPANFRAQPLAAAPPVQVLEQRLEGDYELAVLTASGGQSLWRWLDKHGFKVDAGRKALLDGYAKAGWAFTALKLQPKKFLGVNKDSLGLQALRFTFEAGRPVYPLKISSLNSGPTDLLIYTVGPGLLELKDPGLWPQVVEEIPAGSLNYQHQKDHPPTYAGMGFLELAEALGIAPSTALTLGKFYGRLQGPDMAQDLYFQEALPLAHWERLYKEAGRVGLKDLSFASQHELSSRSAAWAKRLSKDELAAARVTAAANFGKGFLGLEDQERLAHDPESGVRLALARNVNTAPAVLELLLKDTETPVTWDAAGNPALAPAAQLAVALSGTAEMRSQLAGSRKLAPAALAILKEDKDGQVRAILIYWQHLDEGYQLKALSEGEQGQLRYQLAQYPQAAPEALVVMAKDEDRSVRMKVAENPGTPEAVLKELRDDKDEGVRWYLSRRADLDAEAALALAKDPTLNVRRELAQNPACGEAALELLAQDADVEVRGAVARNPKASPAAMLRLTEDANQNIRSHALGDPRVPVEYLKKKAEEQPVHSMELDMALRDRKIYPWPPPTPGPQLPQMEH